MGTAKVVKAFYEDLTTMYRPPQKRSLSLAPAAASPADALPLTNPGPVVRSQHLALVSSPKAQESAAKYEPPHKRTVPTATQRQHSLDYSAPPTDLSRPTGGSMPRHRPFNGSRNFLQTAEARAVINAAATANSTGSRASAVPASGAVPSSKVAAVKFDGSTQIKVDSLSSHSSSAVGQPNFVAERHASPSLVQLLTSADTDVRLDTAMGATSGLSTVDPFVDEQPKAKQLASGQQQADSHGQQKERADGPQKSALQAEGQPMAKADSAPEGQLEFAGSLAQRFESAPKVQEELPGQSMADKGPYADATRPTGMLGYTLSTAVLCTLGLRVHAQELDSQGS